MLPKQMRYQAALHPETVRRETVRRGDFLGVRVPRFKPGSHSTNKLP